MSIILSTILNNYPHEHLNKDKLSTLFNSFNSLDSFTAALNYSCTKESRIYFWDSTVTKNDTLMIYFRHSDEITNNSNDFDGAYDFKSNQGKIIIVDIPSGAVFPGELFTKYNPLIFSSNSVYGMQIIDNDGNAVPGKVEYISYLFPTEIRLIISKQPIIEAEGFKYEKGELFY